MTLAWEVYKIYLFINARRRAYSSFLSFSFFLSFLLLNEAFSLLSTSSKKVRTVVRKAEMRWRGAFRRSALYKARAESFILKGLNIN